MPGLRGGGTTICNCPEPIGLSGWKKFDLGNEKGRISEAEAAGGKISPSLWWSVELRSILILELPSAT